MNRRGSSGKMRTSTLNFGGSEYMRRREVAAYLGVSLRTIAELQSSHARVHGSSAESFHFFFAAKPLWTVAA